MKLEFIILMIVQKMVHIGQLIVKEMISGIIFVVMESIRVKN